jgi:phenylpropionate dioxygenase-like ring-hydroxylating dioxygenase large terminal subunit
MLRKEDNELLTRVGPGTPMGDLMRQYWLPAMYSWELTPDGAPERVRLLGEDLVAFRDTEGNLGLVAENCPHRGASLFFGRNEEAGLRCVYHGWKFDTSGACLDMPNEPPESNFKHKVRVTSYRLADWGGLIWAYMGPRQANPPELPQFEWCRLPQEQVHHAFKGIYHCNWMQGLEGDIDTSHLYFLHGRLQPDDPATYGVFHKDKAPRLEIVNTPQGLLYGARRVESDDKIYWRTTQFLMPIFTLFPGTEDGYVPSHMYTPIDDETTMHWGIRWHPFREMPGDRKLSQKVTRIPELQGMGPMKPTQHGKPFPNWWPVANPENDFLMDREVQKTMNFTGIPTVRLQDGAMTASMGRIVNRTREHLGTTDTMIIQTRRRLINAAKALRERGETPPGVDDANVYSARSASAVLPADVDWKVALADWHHARTIELPAERVAIDRGYPERNTLTQT